MQPGVDRALRPQRKLDNWWSIYRTCGEKLTYLNGIGYCLPG
jgi:hypothetical protein